MRLQDYAGLPLRLSRQLQLGAINEGLAFISRGVQAQLARGFPLDAAGAAQLPSNFHPQSQCSLTSGDILISCHTLHPALPSLQWDLNGRLS